MSRPSQASISLAALRHNHRLARGLHGGRALAVLKANAYGHGATACARALAPEADGFAVAFLEEALSLREAGIRHPILLLEGVFDAAELALAAGGDCWVVVHHPEQLRMLELAPAGLPPLHVWLKADTGMRRAGFAPGEARLAYQRLVACGRAASITWMSHFACADEPDRPMTRRQIEVFDEITRGLPGAQSLCNSAGALAWPAARRDWARPGILLYGVEPVAGRRHGLRPVMSLESRVVAQRLVQPGESVGYGAAFVAREPTRVGLVPLGYADGYPRHLPEGGAPVAIDGILSRIVGRVSMDMLCVDLGPAPSAGPGSRVELWGQTIEVAEVAAAAGTIAYELLCNVKRVAFRYEADVERPAGSGNEAREKMETAGSSAT
ncbi:MAG: alanine racemase [Pigmentiphaga sp.]|nr:alanine racemase [Pigmentiphaga sp.]